MIRRFSWVPTFMPALIIAIAGWSHRWMNEDAYINLRIVEQILAGHGPVFNAGERIEAATSPLWLALLVIGRVLFGWMARDEWIAVVGSLMAAVGGFAIGGHASRMLHRDEARDGLVVPVGLVLVAAVTAVWDFSTSGLEMGLVFLWLGAAWWVLVAAIRSDALGGRRRVLCCVVLGVAPLVRPELGVMMVCLVVAWLTLARPRRVGRDLAAILTLPVAYEIFRMGYYANLFPNTALAKDSAGLHVSQGWNYARDFIDAYHLWVTALLVVAVVLVRHAHHRDRRVAIATSAMLVGAGSNATYIVLTGGDYMHGRLLLPAFFALGLPASFVVPARRLAELAVAGAAAAWAAITIVAFRPPPLGPNGVLSDVSDWRAVSGARIVLSDDTYGLAGHAAHEAYLNGVRGYFLLSGVQPEPTNDPNALVITLGSIGAPAYFAGRQVWAIDIGGLAEPLAARTTALADRPAGHRKQIDPAWYAARFTPPSPTDTPEVRAARHALTCAPIAHLLDAVDGGLGIGDFFSNVVHSFGYARLHIPADPIEAEQRLCP